VSKNAQPQLWLSPAETATRLGTTERVIRSYIASGRLRAKKLGPRLLRIAITDADALLTDADSSAGSR
jgi:excisionase family DNA binding protein